ncbi:Rhodanese-like protein [Amylocystis lapponica]|nr:Rhodanese-like protein [Amylocystis lapponica]
MSLFGDHCPLVLTPAQLQNIHPSESVAVLDTSWHMPNSPRKARAEFLRARIPGAQFFDLDEVASDHPLGLKHMMPTPKVFATACERLGISRNSHVVLYDTHGVFSSPRALFTFRAFGHRRSSILDGGLPAWRAHGGPVESGHPPRARQLRTVCPNSTHASLRRRSRERKVDPAAPIAEIVLDARSRGRYLGTDPEPRAGLSSGHIPHSFSLPFIAFLETQTARAPAEEGAEPETYTTLRTSSALHDALRDAVGAENAAAIAAGERGVVASCGSGMTAGVLWLGLQALGVERVGVYDESWTGYAMREESDIEKGE